LEHSQPEDPGAADSEPSWDGVDRRGHADRREQPTSPWAAFLGLRRRRHGRRDGEGHDIYVDVFHRGDVALLVGIFVLNIFDALFTLIWLRRGGAEGNPVMLWVLEIGDWAFLAQKCFVVGLWLLLLVAHKNFRLARLGLWTAASFYTLLIGYHLVLIASGADPRGHDRAPGGGALEQTTEQGWDHGLDTQWPGPEADGAQPGSEQTLEFEVAPATLGPDRDQVRKSDAGEPVAGFSGMREPATALADQRGQLVLYEGPEARPQ
jgi:hypothetical protein